MAVRKWVEIAPPAGFAHARGVLTFGTDTPLLQGDTTEFFHGSGRPDKTLDVSGNFSGAALVTVQGSDDPVAGANQFTLHDPQGVDLLFNGAGGAVIQENPHGIRLLVTAGDGSTSIVARLTVRG